MNVWDSAYNQVPFIPRISTIKETEPIYVNSNYYRWYPKIRPEDIGSNTSNKFIDTISISNLALDAMCADYDGDQVGVKGVWLQESNKELMEFIASKSHLIGFGGTGIRVPTNESVQSLYNLTLILPQDKKKITKPVF